MSESLCMGQTIMVKLGKLLADEAVSIKAYNRMVDIREEKKGKILLYNLIIVFELIRKLKFHTVNF